MNFKPTKWKVTISVLVGVIMYIYFAGGFKCDSPGGCIEAVLVIPLYYTILLIVIIYLIWSLIQKRRK